MKNFVLSQEGSRFFVAPTKYFRRFLMNLLVLAVIVVLSLSCDSDQLIIGYMGYLRAYHINHLKISFDT